MNAFKDPKSGDSAFVSFEQQTAMLQNMLAKVEPGTHLYEALNGVLVGTMNAQSQMTSWMQEIILSGGKTKRQLTGEPHCWRFVIRYGVYISK